MLRNIVGYHFIVGSMIQALIGMVALYNGYTKLSAIENIKTENIVVVAYFTSEPEFSFPFIGDFLSIDVEWTDENGKKFSDIRLGVDALNADQIQYDGKLLQRDVKIAYSPLSKHPRPIIANEIAYQEDAARVRIFASIPIILMGLVVFAILIYNFGLKPRRRRDN